MALPNTFLVGPPKCATTSLFAWLAPHPQIHAATRKEPLFFVERPYGGPRAPLRDRVPSRSEFEHLYAPGAHLPVRIDATTHYFQLDESASLIADAVPDARVIVIARDPSDRAVSAFRHARRMGMEPRDDLLVALEEDPQRVQENWTPMLRYLDAGRYDAHLSRWSQHVPPERTLVLFFDDVVANPAAAVALLCSFLAIDPPPAVDGVAHNVARGARSERLARLHHTPPPWLRPMLRTVLPPRARSRIHRGMQRLNRAEPASVDTEAVRALVVDRLRDDVEALSRRTGRNLSSWLVRSAPPGDPAHRA